MTDEKKQYTVVTSADVDKAATGATETVAVEKTPEEKAAIEAAAALDADADVLTDEEKQLPPEEQETVKKTRISKNKKALIEAEQRVKDLEQRALDAEEKLKSLEPKPQLKERPKLSQFRTTDDYEKALSAWADEQANVKAQMEYENKVKMEAFRSRQSLFMSENPDYADKLRASGVVVPVAIEEAILDSEFAPDILYHLANNPSDAKLLAGKYGLKELGAIEKTLKAEKKAAEKAAELKQDKPDLSIVKVEQKKAPAPIVPVTGGAVTVETAVTSDGKFVGDFSLFKKMRKEKKIK